MPPVISVQDLRKQYRYARSRSAKSGPKSRWGLLSAQYSTVDALSCVAFSIDAGERVALIGPNGAGKSTTLKILTGILQPTTGQAEVLGLTPWRDRTELAYRIGVVFGQRSQLWPELAVSASFRLLRRIYDQDPAVFGRRLDRLIERFDLSPLLDQPVNRLSLGQRMRCEVVASLLHAPSVLFLDEPTIGLDITAKAAIRELLNEQARRDGLTVVLTSHDTRDIELVCERVIVVNAGRIVVDQSTRDLRRRFLARKLITIRSAAPSIVLDLPGVSRRSAEAHISLLEVDTRVMRIDRVVAAALAHGGIEDITIEDPPMEEVIREIYAN
jgi:ABC-2 type transport system ATP-binding protein